MRALAALRWGRVGGWLGTTGLVASLACGDSTGVVSTCPGAQNVRLHFFNTTNTPNLSVTAQYGGNTCGPVDLPVADQQGNLELAQLLIEGEIGSMVTVQVMDQFANAAAAQCRITELATPGPDITEDKLQAFADVSDGPPLNIICAIGLEPA